MKFAPDWYEEAACKGESRLMFDADAEALAKRLCQSCHVRAACLAHAIAADEVIGIWGGTTPTERERIRRDALRTRAFRQAEWARE